MVFPYSHAMCIQQVFLRCFSIFLVFLSKLSLFFLCNYFIELFPLFMLNYVIELFPLFMLKVNASLFKNDVLKTTVCLLKKVKF